MTVDWNDDTRHTRRSNFPTGFVPRGGLRLKDMGEPQNDRL